MGMDLTKYGNKLFKPFTRFSKKADGKGIGLFLLKSMIEKNEGRIEVASEPGNGTRFSCYLKEYLVLNPEKAGVKV
jgi:signal transduction histidine kinase